MSRQLRPRECTGGDYSETTSSLAYSLWLGHVGTCKELPKG
jgi:hypothetical protein